MITVSPHGYEYETFRPSPLLHGPKHIAHQNMENATAQDCMHNYIGEKIPFVWCHLIWKGATNKEGLIFLDLIVVNKPISPFYFWFGDRISAQLMKVRYFGTPTSHRGLVYTYCNALPISKDHSYLFKVTRSDIQILEALQRQAHIKLDTKQLIWLEEDLNVQYVIL